MGLCFSGGRTYKNNIVLGPPMRYGYGYGFGSRPIHHYNMGYGYPRYMGYQHHGHAYGHYK
jgi:hypothetical protein